jgi:hypothetical protein
MRTIILNLVIIAMLASACGNRSGDGSADSKQQHESTGTAEMIFSQYEHNFGQVTEGEKIGFVFEFENKGPDDLVIEDVTTSCGCTVPKYDTRPIHPGGTGNLEVVFNTSGYNGIQAKTIKVKSNATVPVILLKITAEVVTNNNN